MPQTTPVSSLRPWIRPHLAGVAAMYEVRLFTLFGGDVGTADLRSGPLVNGELDRAVINRCETEMLATTLRPTTSWS